VPSPNCSPPAGDVSGHPYVLGYRPYDVEAVQERRAARCEEHAEAARLAMLARDRETAEFHLDAGERVDPDHRVGHRTWDDLREIVAAKTAAAGPRS
jgi:hypothetical protein